VRFLQGFVKRHADIVAAYNSTYHNDTLNPMCSDNNPETADVTLQLSEEV
jgi:hypothetical protein